MRLFGNSSSAILFILYLFCSGYCRLAVEAAVTSSDDGNNGNSYDERIKSNKAFGASELVLVTGANGYIGSSLVMELLSRGYRVRGTVRDPSNVKKTKALKSFPGASTNLELVQWDLEDAERNVLEMMDEVNWIMHTAAWVDLVNTRDEMQVIRPAVDSMQALLRAAHRTPSVKKFVFTSSVSAANGGHAQDRPEPFTEMDWSILDDPVEPESVITYVKVKTLSERVAWQYMGLHRPHFSFSSILPVMVFGPVPSGDLKSSAQILPRIVDGLDPGLPNVFMAFVDIRDVVEAHIRAATIPEAADKRFLLAQSDGGELFIPEIAAVIRDKFESFGYKITSRVLPKWAVWLYSFIDQDIASVYYRLDRKHHCDNSRSREILGLDYIPANQTLIDAVYSMIEHGMIHKADGVKIEL